jgi:hypothetical protein
MGMGDDCPTPGCGQLAAHPGPCRVNDLDLRRALNVDMSSSVGTRTELTADDVAYAFRRLVEDDARLRFTCPTRNCRRTNEHDAKGCVVETVRSVAKPCGRAGCTLSMVDGRITCQCTEVGGLVFVGPLPDCYPVLAVNVEHVVQDPPDRAYFMSPGFKP